MRINLNLATRPYADIRPTLKRLRIAMLVLVLISGGAYLGLREVHYRAEAARARAHSLDGEIARVSAERQGYINMMQEPDNAQLLAETKTLNGLFDEKAFSWTLTMESLETVLPGGVQVSTLEPARAPDGHIALHMRVIGPRDKGIEFVRNLEHSQRFLLPRIVGETAENLSGQVRNPQPVSNTNRFSFDLTADYNPPSEDEVKSAAGPEKTGGVAAGKRRSGAKKTVSPAASDAGAAAAPAARMRREYKRPAAAMAKPDPGQQATSGQASEQGGNGR
jgi:type IV pilus assembly protein PilN